MSVSSRPRVRVVAVISSVLVVLAAGTFVSPAEARSVTRSISFSASKSSLQPGWTLVLSGKVTKSPKRSKVVIEVRSTGGWKTLKTVRTTTSKGAFTSTVKPTKAGISSYRARVKKKTVRSGKKSTTLKAATSASRKVTVSPVPGPLAPSRLALVSKSTAGSSGNGDSYLWSTRQGPSMSSDGRYVAFYSRASDLVAKDGNGTSDVFLYDRATGARTLVSRTAGGAAGNGGSYWPSISPDGRYVAFRSEATNLGPKAPTKPRLGVYLWDRTTGVMTLVASFKNGAGGIPAVANGGAHVAFTDYDPGTGDRMIYSWARATGKRTLVSKAVGGGPADSASSDPQMSADGRFISFESGASDIVTDDTQGRYDAFLWDRTTGKNVRINDPAGGARYPALSADGRFATYATSLGSGTLQVRLWERATGARTLVSSTSVGDGGNRPSDYSSVSATGDFVAFESQASNLAPGDAQRNPNDPGSLADEDVFVWARATGAVVMVSRSAADGFADGYSEMADVSADGRYVVFGSWAKNLVPGDINAASDVFLWDRVTAPAL